VPLSFYGTSSLGHCTSLAHSRRARAGTLAPTFRTGDAWKLCGDVKGIQRSFASQGDSKTESSCYAQDDSGVGRGHLEWVRVSDCRRIRERQKYADKSVRATRFPTENSLLPRLRSGFRHAAQRPHKCSTSTPPRESRCSAQDDRGLGWGHLGCVGVSCWQRSRKREKHADRSIRATRAKQIFGELAPGF